MLLLKKIASAGRTFYIAVAFLPFFLGALGYWLIVVVDPYSVRTFDLVPPRLGEHRYPDTEWPKLFRTIARQPHDVVLLGGSTTMAIDSQMMRESYAGSRSPINLSYIAPRSLDFADVMERASNIQGLKRIVLIMDFTLLERRPLRSATGNDIQNISTTSLSRGSDFSPKTALASLHRLLRGTFDLYPWAKLDRPEFMIGASPVTDSDATMQRFRNSVAMHRNDVFDNSTLTCKTIPYIAEVLEPFLKKMAKSNVEVDLVFPPIPYVLYYDWIDNSPRFNILLRQPVFDQFMVFKKCVITAKERSGGAHSRVIAVDTVDAISGDLRNYLDSIHLLNSKIYRQVVSMMASGEELITSSNIQSYESRLRQKIIDAGNGLIPPKK